MDLLAINWNVSPFLLRIGNFGLRWYSLLFVGGFIIGYGIFKKFVKKEGVSGDLLDPLLYTLLIATVVGARLGHCLFYEPGYYLTSWRGFFDIFMPWKGGLASHGGAIGLLVAMWWFARHYGKRFDIDFLWLMDHLCITVALAGSLIRLGNLFNSEIYGDVTSLPWGMVFVRAGETMPKHPTQLYEALSYFILFVVMMGLYNRKSDKLYRGTFFGIFMLGCFGMRFLIEFIKEPQVGFEQNMLLDLGQLYSIPFIIAGVAVLVLAVKKKMPAVAVHPEKPKAEPTHYARSLQ